MIGIVVVSHSEKVAEGIVEMAKQMAVEVPIIPVGGTRDGKTGTEVGKIVEGINAAYSEDGVLVFYDIGSAMMNTEMAIELLGEEKKKNVKIVDSALVEGVISAAVYANLNMEKGYILSEMEKIKIPKRY